MSKRTAVQWLWLNLTDDLIGELSPEQIKSIFDLIIKAEAMEKQQIITAFNIGDYRADIDKDGHEYYNETYKGGDNE